MSYLLSRPGRSFAGGQSLALVSKVDKELFECQLSLLKFTPGPAIGCAGLYEGPQGSRCDPPGPLPLSRGGEWGGKYHASHVKYHSRLLTKCQV